MQLITSRTNARIKEAAFLAERRERETRRRFYFEGVHLLEEYLKSGKTPVSLFVTPSAYERHAALLEKLEDRITLVDDNVYARLSEERAPQGIFCVAEYLDNIKENVPLPGGSVILESVRDAGNLGGIIRTAASLGVNCVALSRDCADIYSSKTVRASMGALFSGDIVIIDDVLAAVKQIRSQSRRVFAACLYGDTETLGSFEIKKGDSFVFGNEGAGISAPVAEECDLRVIIPMSGRTESLNVAAASAVIMWEMVKSRG